MTDKRTVYMGALWHHDCDPFASIIATTAEMCQRKLDDAADEEHQHIVDSTEEGEEVEDDIMTGGVFAEDADDLRLTDEELAELDSQGYTYPEC